MGCGGCGSTTAVSLDWADSAKPVVTQRSYQCHTARMQQGAQKCCRSSEENNGKWKNTLDHRTRLFSRFASPTIASSHPNPNDAFALISFPNMAEFTQVKRISEEIASHEGDARPWISFEFFPPKTDVSPLLPMPVPAQDLILAVCSKV